MEKIKAFYLLNNSDEYSDFLFLDFYHEFIVSSTHLSSTFLQIERLLRRMNVKNNLLYKNNSLLTNEKLILKNALGLLETVEVIKKMSTVSHVYEIRMNMDHEKFRVLFFVLDLKNESLISPSLMLSFGFLKRKDRTKKDMTQLLTEETQFVRDNHYKEDFNRDTIGDEFYHEI